MNLTRYVENALPPSPEREELLGLVRLGLAFQKQHVGRRPGALKQYLLQLVKKMDGAITFEKVLDELELEAVRRERGAAVNPIEKIDRVWELVTFHHPQKGRQKLTFKTIKNNFTWCKINRNAKSPDIP